VLKSTKNRFGSTSEIGLFEMTGAGFKAVKESADIFISKEINEMSGSVISSVIEGTRPFLLDIQALVSKTIFGYPQRKSAGFDINRLQVLTAVISKRTKLNLVAKDIILNIVGGLKISDPALDLAVCLAIISSGLNLKVNRQTLVLGEVGLGGEVRSISKIDTRVKSAIKLGFKQIIIPQSQVKLFKDNKVSKDVSIIGVKEIRDLMEIFR
jgi:DNA repair protein RadA/Sms